MLAVEGLSVTVDYIGVSYPYRTNLKIFRARECASVGGGVVSRTEGGVGMQCS